MVNVFVIDIKRSINVFNVAFWLERAKINFFWRIENTPLPTFDPASHFLKQYVIYVNLFTVTG